MICCRKFITLTNVIDKDSKTGFLFVASVPAVISNARCQQVDQFNAAIRKHFRYIDSVRYKDDDTIRSILIGFMFLSRDRKVCFISWYTR